VHLEEVGLLSDKGLPVAEWFSAAANIPSQPSCRRSPHLRAGTCSNLAAPAASPNCCVHSPTSRPPCCRQFPSPSASSPHHYSCCQQPVTGPAGRSARPAHKGNLRPQSGILSFLFSKQSIVQELVPYTSVVLYRVFVYSVLELCSSPFIPYINTTAELQANFAIIFIALPNPKNPSDISEYLPRTSSSCSRITIQKVPPEKCIK